MPPVHRIAHMLAFAALASQSACETTTSPARYNPPDPPVASVEVYPESISLLVGATGMVGSVVRDSAGASLWARSPIWTTGDSNVAVVMGLGTRALVAGRGPGRTTLTASSGGKAAGLSVTILPATDFATIAAGENVTCAVSAAQATYCWGAGPALGHSLVSGGCGDDACIVSPLPVNTTIGFISVQAGRRHTCGLTESGAAYCWGENALEQIGDAAIIETCPAPDNPARLVPCSSRPVPVSGDLTFVALSAGAMHTCGLVQDGEAACWGGNMHGQLGAATPGTSCMDLPYQIIGECSPTPLRVTGGRHFTSITAGGDHTCALTSDGTAYCWGGNASGELGVGAVDTVAHAEPAPVSGDLQFTGLWAGARHTCGLVTGGEVHCWGAISSREVGDSPGQEPCGVFVFAADTTRAFCYASPRRVTTDLRFRTLSLAWASSCGISLDGTVYCWGVLQYQDSQCDSSGCFPSVEYLTTPTRVPGVSPFVAISNGRQLCGIATDRIAYCATKQHHSVGLDPFTRVPGQR